MANYTQQAQQQYDPQYNAKRTAILNELASNQQSLEGQKTGVNNNYNSLVSNQNLLNKKTKNNIANTWIGRGMTRGTGVTSNLGEQDNINNRTVGDIELRRTGDLNNIEAQKALLSENTNNTLATMAGDRESQVATLARQLQNEDFARNIQQQQLALQRAAQAFSQSQAQNDDAYKYAALQWQKDQYADQKSSAANQAQQALESEQRALIASIMNDSETDSTKKQQALSEMIDRYGSSTIPAAYTAYGNITGASGVGIGGRVAKTSSSSVPQYSGFGSGILNALGPSYINSMKSGINRSGSILDSALQILKARKYY